MKTKLFFILFFISAFQLFAQNEIKNSSNPFCGTPDNNIDPSVMKIIREANAARGSARMAAQNLREIRIAIVVDSTMYYAYQQDTVKIKEVAFRKFREASTVFESDFGIRLNITSFEFLKKNKRYNNNANNFFNDYRSRYGILGDIILLWSVNKGEPYGGIGNYPTAQSIGPAMHIVSGNSDFAFQEINTQTIMHEIGHNLGSLHTHDCNWPGGAFEVCTDVEGTCKNWATDAKIASIMSYCETGNSFVFHPLCKDVINNVASSRLQVMEEAPKGKVVLQFPKNEDQNFYPSDYYSWNSVEKINGYQIVISENTDFSNPLLDSLVADNMAYIGKTFKRNTTYYWRVRGQNEKGSGDWSKSSSFKTHQTLTLKAPILEFVNRNKSNENQQIVFKPVTDAQEYIIEFYKGFSISTNNFNSEKRVKSTSNRLETLMPAIEPGSNNTFVYRIRAVSDATMSDWSKVSPSITYNSKAKTYIGSVNTPVNTFIAAKIELPLKSQKFEIDYEISKTSDFKTTEIKKTISQNYYFRDILSSTNSILPVENLAPNRQYFYRIKAKNEADSMNSWVTGQFNTSYESRWKSFHSENSALPFGGSTRGLFIDKQNNKWIFGAEGLIKQTPDGKFKLYNRVNTGDLIADNILEIVEDENGRIWFATSDGISMLENDNFTRYPSTIWGTKDPLGKSRDKLMYKITAGKNNVYTLTTSGKIIRFTNNSWTNITGNNTFSGFSDKLRQEENGNLWVSNFDFSTQRSSFKIYNGTSWSAYKPAWSFLNSNPILDNKGNFWYKTSDSLYVVSGVNAYKSISKNVKAIYELSNQETPVDLSFYFSAVYITDKKTYYFASNSDQYVEFDGNKYHLKTFPFLALTGYSYPEKMFAVDKNDKISFIQNSGAIHEFDRSNIVADFKEKQLFSGCNLKFRLGVFSPPTGDASTNKLKVMLSDGAEATFKEIAATYSNGEITAIIPPNTAAGKGYRFKFTMDDSRYVSQESEVFEIMAAPISSISGNNTICLGATITLTAKNDFGKAPYSYKWYEGSNAVGADKDNLSINKAGDYSVEITDANGCIFNSATTKITEKGIAPIISAVGQTTVYQPKTVLLNATNASNASYQWQKNGVDIIGEVKPNYEAKESGDYLVIIKSDGCVGTSNILKVLIEVLLGNELQNEKIEIFPNPTASILTVLFTEPKTRTIEIIDSKGKILWEKTSKNLKETYNLQHYPTGMYLVQIKVGNQIISKRIMKIE